MLEGNMEGEAKHCDKSESAMMDMRAEQPTPSQQPDPLLLPFLQATDEAVSQRAVERLVHEHAEPVIQGVIRRKMGVALRSRLSGRQSQDEQWAEDVRGEVIVQLLTRLRDLKSRPNGEVISSWRGYVAVTAYRACDKHLRQKYPQRWSLKNRLRYLLTHQPGLALWASGEGDWCCGFAVWRDQQKTAVRTGRLQQLCDNPQSLARTALPQEDLARMDPRALLAAIFNHLTQPIELDDLVNIVADLQGIRDEMPTSGYATTDAHDKASDLIEQVRDRGAGIDEELSQRAYLEHLWSEIRQLPPRQRVALLLNLRDGQGRGVIALLPLTGVATLRQIADALDMSAEKFAALWNDLPLDDNTIAEHLNLTRQQVINLRKVARERLARRMRVFEEETP
jgi:hypothetical protein